MTILLTRKEFYKILKSTEIALSEKEWNTTRTENAIQRIKDFFNPKRKK